ncbi:MAG: hypothetical protein IJY11_00885 [Clostridia bacterium]|nr:hypothetical protein [Clostridia bacterium]
MKSFSKYTQTQREEIPKSYTQEDDVAKLTKMIAEAYDGKPSADVLKSILKQAEASKRAGTLTNADIDAFYEQFSPLVDDRQRKMLQTVVEKLKRI